MPLAHLLLLLTIVLFWGVNFTVMKVALLELSPLGLAVGRFFLTSIPAIFFFKRPAAPFKKVALYGLVLFGLQFPILFLAMQMGLSAGIASILLQTQAFFSAFFAWAFLKEEIKIQHILGGILALFGIGIVAMNLGGDVGLEGLVLILIAASLWALSNLLSKQMGPVDKTALVAWGSLVAWPPLLALAFLLGEADSLFSLSLPGWGALGFISYPSTLFAFGAWNWLLGHYPMSRIAPFSLLVPVIGMTTSVLFFGEELSVWKVGGAVLIIGGLAMGQSFLKKSTASAPVSR